MDTRIHRLLADGVRDRVHPGAAWAHGDAGSVRGGGAVGSATAETVFDLASLTKIVAVWAVLGTLRDGFAPDAPLGGYWPEVSGHPLGAVTAHQLLTHTAGVPLHAELAEHYGSDPAAIRAGVLHEALHRPPGQAVEYTDRAALILGYLAEHLTGRPLDRLATERVWQPLGMRATRFGPVPPTGCAPTEDGLHGVVHDPSARLLGGVCGIAGVFSTTGDLGRFLAQQLTPTPWTEQSLTIRTGRLVPPRGLFWHPAPNSPPARDIWTHYGFTGTALWLSPSLGRWAVLLTNKVHFTRERGPMNRIREAFCELAFG
ncbi:serine hydrolase domain-containing protein [Kitasatospora viridis]|uniref:CubicO group peptidase (Beta-lactamase class C family) n=1 Tax=Kitasatospora viridis TaxID=281105 RepID=A0A561ULL5_9ACTN|nr:serine hydrolase domain-containing protein [Kitasatospora viridis]TWG00239.1 CubicO group peptidase (beta-lactamase class C family) [Kitasatospora viridis]